MYKIFISHYSQEKPIAENLKNVLNEAYQGHAKFFISSNIATGTNWLKGVKEKIQECNEILTIFTYKSMNRPWINIETGYGVMSDMCVTPILCSGFRFEDLEIIYKLQQAVVYDSKSDVCRLFNDILSRIHIENPDARTRWDQEEFWRNWKLQLDDAIAITPVKATRSNINPVVWLMGSHRHLSSETEQQKALQVCQVIARACYDNSFQIVMGTSRMLEYLADEYANYAEPQFLANTKGEQFRKALANEQAISDRPVLNPLILLGSLRNKPIKEIFDDAIGRIPDIAVLIGGKRQSDEGRASQEQQKAIDAGIPFLPLKFTGGAAAECEPTVDISLISKTTKLQKLFGDMSRFKPLFADIVNSQFAINSNNR